MKLLQLYLVSMLLTCSGAFAQADPFTYAENQEALPFNDIEDSPFRNAIIYLAADEYIGGFPDGGYRPEQQITRAEFIVVALRASLRIESRPSEFQSRVASLECLAELDAHAWYADELCAAAEQKIIDDDTQSFRPDSPLTYSEALKVLLTAFQLTPDALQVADGVAWHEPYQQFADSNGLLPLGSYNPSGALTRELAANLLYRTLVMQQDPANLPSFDENAVLAAAISAAVLAGRAAMFEPFSLAAQPSSGCSAPVRPPLASLTVGGRERSIITHVPSRYDPNLPASLVIAFHGRTNSNAQVRNYMDLERFAPDAIVVYPGGIPLGSGGYSWSDGGDRADSLRDYALFDEIVSTFARNYCIDSGRIFVVGHSLGAWFANSLACARADVIRAAATLAGGIAASNCKSTVAALLLHNPRDALVAISEGQQARDVFLGNNQLLGTTPQPLSGRFNCSRYQTENHGAPVVWCPHEIDYPFGNYYDPHSWPSGTGQLIMEFFSELQ